MIDSAPAFRYGYLKGKQNKTTEKQIRKMLTRALSIMNIKYKTPQSNVNKLNEITYTNIIFPVFSQ